MRLRLRCDRPLAHPERYPDDARSGCSAAASTCPLRRLEVDDPWAWDVVADLRAYQRHGTLWRAGGIGDQPSRWWLLLQAAQAEDVACDREEEEERERRRKADEARAKARRSK